jgi:hypothetical protein
MAVVPVDWFIGLAVFVGVAFPREFGDVPGDFLEMP